MTDEQRRARAKAIFADDVFSEIMAGMEATALNRLLLADLSDDRARADLAAEIRVIRAVRQRIESLANEGEFKPRAVA